MQTQTCPHEEMAKRFLGESYVSHSNASFDSYWPHSQRRSTRRRATESLPHGLSEYSSEVLLENDKLVVQRFIVEPGQWEGIHRHPPDQLYIHIKGGEWTVKYGDAAETSISPTGEVGWSDDPTEFSAMHESGDTGDEPIDLIWVNLNPGCMTEPEAG